VDAAEGSLDLRCGLMRSLPSGAFEVMQLLLRSCSPRRLGRRCAALILQ
jgi:hypothetical protein